MRTCKQISDLLQIDFHIRDFDKILQMRVTLDNGLEYLFCYPGYNTLEIVRVNIRSLEIRVSG